MPPEPRSVGTLLITWSFGARPKLHAPAAETIVNGHGRQRAARRPHAPNQKTEKAKKGSQSIIIAELVLCLLTQSLSV